MSIKFDFKFQKKYGFWHSFLQCTEMNKKCIKVMLCYDIANAYLKNEEDKFIFQSYILKHDFNDFYSFFEDVDKFCQQNNIDFCLNYHTSDKSPIRKLTAKMFEHVLFKFARFMNYPKRVKMSDGISHDVSFGDIKIDAKTKNGISKFFNKNYQLTTAYNTQENNNNADYYCFGVCARDYWKENNILNFVLAGVIEKKQFYQNARVRQIGQVICGRDGTPSLKDGEKMYAKKSDYVIYADILKPIQMILK